MKRHRSRASTLTPRTSFLVLVCLASGAGETSSASTARLGELRSQERVIRDLMGEVDEQIQSTTHLLDDPPVIDKQARMLEGLKAEYRRQLARLSKQRREEESKQVAISVSGLLDVHFETSEHRRPLYNVRFSGAVDEGGLEMLQFVSRDGLRTWTIDPSIINWVQPGDVTGSTDPASAYSESSLPNV